MSFDISRRFWRVWQRNLTVYTRTWAIGFLPPLLEPLFYIAAFGIGLGGMIGRISHQGATVDYVTFIAPALIAINIMQSAFFENTFASFVRMYYQKTFDAMLATPLTLDEVIFGEIVWGATKAVIGTTLMMTVIGAFGLLRFPEALLLLPVAFLGGLAFAATGMLCTAVVPTIEVFNLPIFLFITPMFLFSGTFFPLTNLPAWAQGVAGWLPLTHLAELCRVCALGQPWQKGIAATIYLLCWSAVAVPLALWRMRRRLVL